MPNPTPSDVHVNRPLTNIAVGYLQDQKKYVAHQVFPIVPVQRQSDRYFQFDKGDLLRDEAKERAPGTETAGGGVGIDNTPSYFAKVYGFHEDVDDQQVANADTPLKPKQDASENVTQKLLIRRERVWAGAYFKDGVWDTDITGKSSSPGTNEILQWDQANSTPIVDVDNTKDTVEKLTGFLPNVMVVGPEVFTVLKNHTTVLERIKYTQRGLVTEELLAGLFGVNKFLVARAIYNTATEGATASMARIFGKGVLLAYANPSPGIKKPSAGYTFAWIGLLGSGEQGLRIKRFRVETLGSDRVEGEMAFDPKAVAKDCGAFVKSAIG